MLPKLASAGEWSLQIDWPPSPTGFELTTSSGVSDLVLYFFEWGVGFGVIFSFGVLIYASLKYITSAGNPNKLGSAKEMISSAFSGLLLLFSSWLLIGILNPELGVISDITVSSVQYQQDLDFGLYGEDDLCDYGITSFTLRGETQKYKTMINEGEVREIHMEPYQSIACKSKRGFGDDLSESDKVVLREFRPIRKDELSEPVCNLSCAQDRSTKCDPQIEIDPDNMDAKYCYDLREEEVKIGLGVGWQDPERREGVPGAVVDAVKYVSQKPTGGTSCMAGDKKLEGGGGCVVNLYETTLASRCGYMVSSINPTGSSIEDSYDKDLSCVELIRQFNPINE